MLLELHRSTDNNTLKTDFSLVFQGKPSVNDPDIDALKYILLGMVGGLVIVLAILTTSLMCTRRK